MQGMGALGSEGMALMTLHSQRKTNSSHWKKIRARVLMRDGYECQLRTSPNCSGEATTVDHLYPVAKGGDDSLDNLVAACGPCNYAKGSKVIGLDFLQVDSTLPPYRGFLSPPNDSKSFE
jgi:5-methylcytosine-specific restriction endonuclease McrA